MSTSPLSLSPTAQRWARLVAAHERSNLSLSAFAARQDVNASTLAWWRSRLRNGHAQPGFVEVRVDTAQRAAEPAPTLRLVVRATVYIEVPEGSNLGWLRQVVEALS